MNVLIIKYYKYDSVRSDSRFSFEIAFRRLNGVLETVRKVLPNEKVRIIVPEDELAEAKKYVELNLNEHVLTLDQVIADEEFFNDTSPILVFDEQGFYASPELVQNVINESHGQPCTWNDPERLLWSFNYHDSCRFFIASSSLVKKYLKSAVGFLQLQNLVFEEGKGKHYIIKPEDIPPVYKMAVKFNPYPYHFYIEPTSRCNSKCIMCPFHSPDPEIVKGRVYIGDGGEDMPLETFKKLVDEIASIGWNYLPHYRNIQITPQMRGESTLAPNCRDMFAYVKEKGFRLAFTTNGSTLHIDNLAEYLVDIGTDEIVVSIDGDEEEYSKIRPALNYKQVVENLMLLRKLRDEKSSNLTIYTKNVHLRVTPEDADRKYIRKFSPIVDWAGIAFENYDDFYDEGKKFTDYFFDVEDNKRVPCIWSTDVAVIKAEGTVDMCFGASEHYIGNVYSKSLLVILRESSLRNKIINNHSKGDYSVPKMCNCCTSWKHNFHIFYEEDDYIVRKNPVLAYWKRKS